MLVTRSTLFLALSSAFFLPCALGDVHEDHNDAHHQPATPTEHHQLPTELQSLLAQADRVALHAALHESHPSFTDGTHENDLAAMEAVHRESPPLATRILELARRQNGNSSAMTTSLPDGVSQSTDLYLTTFTAPDGQPRTITAITIVAVTPTGANGRGGGAAKTSGSGSSGGVLQNGSHLAVSKPWKDANLVSAGLVLSTLVLILGLA